MSHKPIFVIFLSLIFVLSACGKEQLAEIDENASTSLVETTEETEKYTDETSTEISDSNIYSEVSQRILTSNDFIFSNFGKIDNIVEKPVDLEMSSEYDFYPVENSFQELIGINYNEESPVWYFLTREKNWGTGVSGHVSGLSIITEFSPEESVNQELIKSWNADGYTYEVVKASSDQGGQIMRLDYLISSKPTDNSDVYDTTYETIYTDGQKLKNDENLQKEVGEFELNQLSNAWLINEPIEIESNITKAIIHSMSYRIDQSMNAPYIELDIEFFPKEDEITSVELSFPYSNNDGYHLNQSEIYKGIPLRETYTFYEELPFLYLEEQFILMLDEESFVINFEKSGFTFPNTVSLDGLDIIGFETIDYKINFVDKVYEDNGKFIGTISNGNYDDESKEFTLTEKKGTISAPEGGADLYIEYEEYIEDESLAPFTTLNGHLKKPTITVTPKLMDN